MAKEIEIDIKKIMNRKPKSKKQHLIAINDENYNCLKIASSLQGYSQHGVYLNEILAEFFKQIGIIEQVEKKKCMIDSFVEKRTRQVNTSIRNKAIRKGRRRTKPHDS